MMKKIALFSMLFLTCTLSFANAGSLVKYDAEKGEYRRRDTERIFIVGKVVNIAYQLQHRPGGADAQDALFSKGRQGLMTSGGTIWTFVDNIKGQELQWNTAYLGKYVTISGWPFHDAHYIEVDSFSIGETSYAWNDKTNMFEPAGETISEQAAQ